MTAAATVTATFTLTSSTLTVALSGNGAGTVTSSPAGISCGADCTEPYLFGTAVTLTASATDGSAFTGWTGGGCTGTGTCIVTMNAATSVTASFSVIQAKWPDSFARYCTDLANTIACPGGPAGQDGHYLINVPTYAQVGARIQDQVTGLVWQRNAPTTGMNFADATAYCNTLTLDGLGGWRVPSYLELVSIADFGVVGPPFPTPAFPGIPQNSYFWTTTDRPGGPTQTFGMNTNYPVTSPLSKTDATDRLVRCVRGTTFSGSLSVNGGSVTDSRTNLVWQSGVAPTDMTFSNALAYCEALVLDGNSDWRLPSGKELMSIVDVTQSNPSISAVFAARPATRFWSSSPLQNFPTNAYVINFGTGFSDDIGTVVTQARSVRCVRGG